MITAPVTPIKKNDRCRFYSFAREAKDGEHERCAYKGFNFECSKNCPYREIKGKQAKSSTNSEASE